MTETSAIATALASLAQVIYDINTHATSTATTPTTRTPLLDNYNPATPFELSSRSGSTAYADACTPLSEPWESQAAIKYANISAAQEGKFTGSEKTITKYIVSITADSTCR